MTIFSKSLSLMQRHHSFILTILLLGTLVFGPVVRHGFLAYDDELNVTSNRLVTELTPANLLHFWQGPHEGLYIPLTYNLWSLTTGLSSLLFADRQTPHPGLFHLVNLLLHLATSVGVFLLLRGVLAGAGGVSGPSALRDELAPALGALLFAVHPLQVEAVAWVTGLKDVLSGSLSILALGLYLSYATNATGSKRVALIRYGLATLFFLLALLAKPAAIVVPWLAGLIGWLLCQRRWPQLGRELLPWVLLSLPVIIITKVEQPDSLLTFLPTLGQRLLIVGDSLAFYLYKLLLPLSLGPDYGRTPQFVLDHGWSYLTGLAPYLVVGGILWKAPKAWQVSVGIFALTLAPVLGLVPFDFQRFSTVADRYCYLALLGPAFAVAWWLSRYRHRAVLAASLVVVLVFAIMSGVQVSHWTTFETFYRQAIAVNPNSWLSHNNLAVELCKEKRTREGVELYQRAVAINPRYALAFLNLGKAYSELKQEKEAIAAFNKAVALDPQSAESHHNLGVLYQGLGRNREAIEHLEQAIGLDGTRVESSFTLAVLLANMNDRERAIELYRQVIAQRSDSIAAYNNLALLFASDNRTDEAIVLYRRAIEVNPRIPDLYNNLAKVYVDGGRREEAVAVLLKAVAVKPDFAQAYNNLSVVYLAMGRYDLAIQYADKAGALGYSDPVQQKALGPFRTK